MRDAFFALADALTAQLEGAEHLLVRLQGEASDFVRLSRNGIGQAGHVVRRRLELELIQGARHAVGGIDLAGDMDRDLSDLATRLRELRVQLPHLPDDPYLSYATEGVSSEQVEEHRLPDSRLAVEQVMRAAEGLDLVGIWASGRLETGFANSLGQRNWHASASFNLDWSCYHRGDKAVKASYAGSNWMPGELPGRMASVRDDLAAMARTPLTIPPGRYRVYLAPRALQDLLDMLAWGGFDLKSRRTGQSPLIRMVADGWALHPSVTLVEDQALGLAPGFTGEGFAKPAHVALIEEGRLADCLVDARSGKEYGVAVNAAGRAPESLEMGAGSLAEARVLEALDTGLFVSRLWYLNYSDRSHARLTGMIRFACFWVERGQVRAPVNVMRFDDSVFHLLGDRLEGLTAERELILDPQTYGGRSYRSWRLPGALIEGMTFTL